MNNVIENMKTRRSVRGFDSSRMPSDNLINEVIEAGMYAPTGRGAQSPIIIKVTDKETRDLLSKMNASIMGTDTDPFYGAPVVLIVLADRTKPTYIYDGSLVMGNLLNAAHAVGLGSCWIHRTKEEFDSADGKELLKKWGVDGDYEGIGHCILGYALPGCTAEYRPRKENYVYSV